MENIFAKFDNMFNVEELKRDIEEASSSNFEKKDVPYGDYEVKVTKLELGEHTFDDDYKGMPVVNIWFKIISEGEYKGQVFFVNKRLISLKNPKANGFLIKKANELIDSLESGIPVTFESWAQYGDLLKTIFAEIDGRAEYQLAFFENNGYKDYAIVKRFQ